eukprot:NODE_172_length_15988_cov_0.603940.p9 type:complete len:182 gc:universal NODE_172_length_15988_cov_0.603940:687-1232(+)
MSTSLKDAIKKWEKESGMPASEAKIVRLIMCQPMLQKLDPNLQQFQKVEKLSMSTNIIDKISNLSGLSHLKILSIGRNNIKKIEGLDGISDTLEELWISYNQIEKCSGLEQCKKLKVFYCANNRIKTWDALAVLRDLPCLEEINLVGNPIEERCSQDGTWRDLMNKQCQFLKKLDGKYYIK